MLRTVALVNLLKARRWSIAKKIGEPITFDHSFHRRWTRLLVRKADVGLSTIVRLEKGLQAPTFQTIKRLAAALEVEPSELVVEDE